MKLKHRNKVYSSDDVPLFLYFKTNKKRKEFSDILLHYGANDKFIEFPCLHAALAGNVVIKDKRATIYFSLDSVEEKKVIQKSLFSNTDENCNSLICSPSDINEDVLIEWVENNLSKIV